VESSIPQLISSLAANLSVETQAILGTLTDSRDEIRAALGSDIRSTPPVVAPPTSLCAIDGSRITQKMYAADLIIAVAAAADGARSTQHIYVPPLAWGKVLPANHGNDRLAATAMAALEVSVVASAPHDVRILDGGFITPLAGFREGFAASSSVVREHVSAVLTDPSTNPLDALEELYTNTSERPVLALPKSDSSQVFTRYYNTIIPPSTMGDRFLATQILNPGEYLSPIALTTTFGHMESHQQATTGQKRVATETNRIAGILASRAASGELFVLYMKPPDSTTVLRIEYFASNVADAVHLADTYTGFVAAETFPPFLLEPYPQDAADKEVKQISASASALRGQIVQDLPEGHRRDYGHLITRNYRT
jgi:hypothetical protein